MSSASRFKIIHKHAGQSLVQVLVAVAIMGIMMAAFASMMNNMYRETAMTNQKLASLDLMRMGTTALANPDTCKTIVTLDTISLSPAGLTAKNSPEFVLKKIPATPDANGPVALVASSSTPASGLSNSLFITSIKLNELNCGSSPCVASSSTFRANVTVEFDQKRLIKPIAPLKFPVIVGSTGPLGAQTITNCSGGTPPPCPPTTISDCTLPAANSGSASAGACAGGFTGTCNYTCNLGSWTSPSSNTCTAGGGACQATTISNCSLPAITNGQASGSCVGGTTGSCSYTCGGSGNWSAPSSNTCTMNANLKWTALGAASTTTSGRNRYVSIGTIMPTTTTRQPVDCSQIPGFTPDGSCAQSQQGVTCTHTTSTLGPIGKLGYSRRGTISTTNYICQ